LLDALVAPATVKQSLQKNRPMTAAALTLTRPRELALTAIGVAVWIGGVALVRALDAAGALSGPWALLVYAAIIPGTAPLITQVPRLLGLPEDARLGCAAVMAGTAALMDGVVVRFFPWVYAADPTRIPAIAGTLIWAFGVAFVLGYVMTPRR
jgi:hypothetical protein